MPGFRYAFVIDGGPGWGVWLRGVVELLFEHFGNVVTGVEGEGKYHLRDCSVAALSLVGPKFCSCLEGVVESDGFVFDAVENVVADCRYGRSHSLVVVESSAGVYIESVTAKIVRHLQPIVLGNRLAVVVSECVDVEDWVVGGFLLELSEFVVFYVARSLSFFFS